MSRYTIGRGKDRFTDVATDLALVDVPSGDNPNIAWPVSAQTPMHQSDLFVGSAVLIMRDTLDERTRAVPDAYNCDIDGFHSSESFLFWGLLKGALARSARV